MEQTAPSGIVSPRKRNAVAHKRKAATSLPLRLKLAYAMALVLCRMSHEEARRRIGDSDGSKWQCRKDVSDIRSRNAARLDRIGWERMLYIAEQIGVDIEAALTSRPPGMVH